MRRSELVEYLDKFFAINTFSGDPAQNGLQVEGGDEVSHIASAVDACRDSFAAAAKLPAQLLLVHHGLFWQHNLLITGVHKQRIAALLRHDISLYALHLPLDAHAELGNNSQLAKLLQLDIVQPFGNYHNYEIGIEATAPRPIVRETFMRRVGAALHTSAHLLPFGPAKVQRIAIVSGGGGFEIARAARQGFDLLLTGEVEHSHFYGAQEHKINVIYAGHYATETVGVKALGEHLHQMFGLPHTFLDLPTGF